MLTFLDRIKAGSSWINGILELLGFLCQRKRFILIPVFLIIIILGILVVFGQGSVLLPLVYTLV